jgi:DNA repair photolyase
MPLMKSRGNMYDWVTHMHTHLMGECPNKCVYCYVGKGPSGRPHRYIGPPRFSFEEFKIDYGNYRTIFIEHMNDMFAEGINPNWIMRILRHCHEYPTNTYVIQTKNPMRALLFADAFPPNRIVGTTIESDFDFRISQAPLPRFRLIGIKEFALRGFRTFITIEPVMEFSRDFADMIIDARPGFVNIGADSKGCGLREPDEEALKNLIERLNKANVIIKKKTNLARLLPSRQTPE